MSDLARGSRRESERTTPDPRQTAYGATSSSVLGSSGRGARATCRTRAWCLRRSRWTNNRNVTQMLEFLMMRGEIAIAGRVGRERLWDLAERCIRPTSSSRPKTTRIGSRTSGGSPRSASPGRRAPPCRSSRSTSATPASRPWSKARRASGGRSRRARDEFEGRTAVSPSTGSQRPAPRAGAVRFRYAHEIYKPAADAAGAIRLRVLPVDRVAGRTRNRRPQSLRVAVHAIHQHETPSTTHQG